MQKATLLVVISLLVLTVACGGGPNESDVTTEAMEECYLNRCESGEMQFLQDPHCSMIEQALALHGSQRICFENDGQVITVQMVESGVNLILPLGKEE